MADNFAVKDASGTSTTIGAKDLSTVYLTKHIIVDDAGDIALVSVANAALAENAAKFLQTASVGFALDAAASAAAQAVPLQVESTAQPNLKVCIKNGANQMPAGDAVARRVYVQHTDGTNSTPSMDAAARPGFQKITDGTNTQPTGDAAARVIYHTPAANAANGGSMHSTVGLDSTVVAVKASAGTLYSLVVTNTHSATQYVQVWDTASGSVTVGTTAPKLVVAVPTGTTVPIGLGAVGLTFGTAISIAATTTATGATTAVASTVHVCGSFK